MQRSQSCAMVPTRPLVAVAAMAQTMSQAPQHARPLGAGWSRLAVAAAVAEPRPPQPTIPMRTAFAAWALTMCGKLLTRAAPARPADPLRRNERRDTGWIGVFIWTVYWKERRIYRSPDFCRAQVRRVRGEPPTPPELWHCALEIFAAAANVATNVARRSCWFTGPVHGFIC